jgi:hypothetical protein
MSFFSRRTFLNFLGVGGLAATGGFGLSLAQGQDLQAPLPDPKVPLFGSDEEPTFVVPDQVLMGRHYIVERKKLVERAPAGTTSAYGTVVGRLVRDRVPRGEEVKGMSWRSQEFRQGVTLERQAPTLEYHVAFWEVARRLQAQVAEFSRETLAQVPKGREAHAVLVTIVDSEIHVRPDENGEGFEAACSFTQHVFWDTATLTDSLATFKIYSEKGEYPLLLPSDLDFNMLVKLDHKYFTKVPNRPTRSSMGGVVAPVAPILPSRPWEPDWVSDMIAPARAYSGHLETNVNLDARPRSAWSGYAEVPEDEPIQGLRKQPT